MSKTIRMAGLLPCLLLGACFEYASVAPATVPPQATAVRVRLSRPMSFPISDVTVRDVVELQGEVAGVRDTTFRLSVFELRSQTGFGVDAAGETVEFPSTAVVGLAQRRISPWRTALFGALLAASGVAVAATGVVAGGGGAGTGPGSTK
jgi:hypothetical protein